MAGEVAQSLPESWEVRRLDEVATIIDSLHKTPSYSDVGSPMVRVTDVQGGFLDLSKTLRVSEEVFQEFTRRYAPKRGDMVFSRVGSYGNVSYARTDTPFCLGQNTALISPRINGRFLHLFLQSAEARWQIEKVVVGSTQKTISLKSISELQIPIPPPDELEAIAAVHGALDDKIELNQRINETLEAMARALFQSWFVDFDPVRAKAEGRNPGLPQHFADLFPDSFEDSELGEIPRGWEVKPIRDLTCYLSRGISPSYLEDGGICVLNQKCIRDRRIDFAKARRHDLDKKAVDGRLLSRLDVLVNSTGVGTLGRAAQLWNLHEPAIVDSHVSVLRAAPGVDPWFLGVGLTGRESEIEALGEGSTGQTELSRVRLGELACVVPPTKLQHQFGSVAEQLFGRLATSQEESVTLATLRDTLLPKLISGELRVKDAERFTERLMA